MDLEDKLQGWTKPSSDTEQEKQERTERMVREAIKAHEPLQGANLHVYTKGSYPNMTNVRTDSDVDVGVECRDCIYWDEATSGAHPASSPYGGVWTPQKLRLEVVAALKAKFPNQVDTAGSTAIRIRSSSARVDADVVPCFQYHYYLADGSYLQGAKTFRKSSSTSLVNWPTQHLSCGEDKQKVTGKYFKPAVRILKRVENAMVEDGTHREVPSFFVECLVYNCPDSLFKKSSWVETTKALLYHIWENTQGDSEPSADRWIEVNRCKYLFHSEQKWTRKDGRDFSKAAWNYLGFA